MLCPIAGVDVMVALHGDESPVRGRVELALPLTADARHRKNSTTVSTRSQDREPNTHDTVLSSLAY